jgi:LPXTG-motif cell wall-anchored protein
MLRHTKWLTAALASCAITLAASSTSAQTQSTQTEIKDFEVVSVDGNKVVLKGAEGSKEITVPADFRFTVDGRQVSVNELRPGMRGSATITTTTTVTPVTVTEVKNGDVMQVTGSSIIVRTDQGIKSFSEGDVKKRGVKIVRDGQPLAFTDLRSGDKLTATIVTTHPPKVMTERQVQASLSSPAPAAAPERAAPSASAAAPESTTASSASATPRRLPKTASPLPFVGLLGAGLLTAGVTLTARRRRRND